jgi:hypothetical protein
VPNSWKVGQLLSHGREFDQKLHEKSNAPHMSEPSTLGLNIDKCIIFKYAWDIQQRLQWLDYSAKFIYNYFR